MRKSTKGSHNKIIVGKAQNKHNKIPSKLMLIAVLIS